MRETGIRLDDLKLSHGFKNVCGLTPDYAIFTTDLLCFFAVSRTRSRLFLLRRFRLGTAELRAAAGRGRQGLKQKSWACGLRHCDI